MEKLKPCPFCPSGKGIAFKDNYDKYGVYCNSCNSQTGLYSTIDDAITAWNTRPDSWISVKDRTPKNGDCVLCVSGAGIVQIALYDTSVYVYGFYANSVTHWMPLPEPPKGSEN